MINWVVMFPYKSPFRQVDLSSLELISSINKDKVSPSSVQLRVMLDHLEFYYLQGVDYGPCIPQIVPRYCCGFERFYCKNGMIVTNLLNGTIIDPLTLTGLPVIHLLTY